jgi:hypothetical protein
VPAGLPVTDEVLAIPLGPRRLVGTALDLLTRSDAGLRSASFYIGFLMLATVGPMVALLGLALVTSRGEDPFFGGYGEAPAWTAWLFLAMIPGLLGFVGAGVEARTLATAVIGGRAEGRPLRLRESIAIARRRFWSILGVQVLLGLVTVVASLVVGLVLGVIVGPTGALDYGLSVILGVAIGAPFVYAPSGIVLGEATATVALGRSIRLAIARKRLAIVVTLFSVLSQLILQLGLGTALDTVSRLLAGTGMLDAFPVVLVVPVVAALVFAYGTLVFLVEAIAAAPAVHAFEALTHYTAGLELGRREPLAVRHWWDPWMTAGLVAMAAVALVALVGGVLSLRL